MSSHAQTVELGLNNILVESAPVEPSIVIPEIIVEDKTLRDLFGNLLSIIDSELPKAEKQSKLIDAITLLPVTHFYTVLTNITAWIDERTMELIGNTSEQEALLSEKLQSLNELRQVVSLGITAQLNGLLAGKLIEEHTAINSSSRNLLKLRGKEFLVMLGVVLTAISLLLMYQGYKVYQEEVEQKRQDALGMKVDLENLDRVEDILAGLEL